MSVDTNGKPTMTSSLLLPPLHTVAKISISQAETTTVLPLGMLVQEIKN